MLAKYYLGLSLFTTLVLGNFFALVGNLPFYQLLYQKLDIYQSFGNFSVPDESTRNLFQFFLYLEPLNKTFFSEQAMQHLLDVRWLLLITFGIYLSSLVSCVLLFRRIGRISPKAAFQILYIACGLLIVLIVVIAVVSHISFTYSFLLFHKLVFRNMLWLFPPEDTLIQLFPEDFFIAFTQQLLSNIIITTGILGLITAIGYKRYVP